MSPESFAAALAGLPSLGPGRLRRILGRYEPAEAWQVVLGGHAASPPLPKLRANDPPDLGAVLARQAAAIDVERVGGRCEELGVGVHLLGSPLMPRSPSYPRALAPDPAAPAVLFSLGDLAALDGRRVTVVGTRNATAGGLSTARTLGHELAAASVRVVSGLALGIDGAAHAGALAAGGAPCVGVVGCGLDRPYPSRHVALWRRVGEEGLLLAEVPPGTEPAKYRFPERNRILAALGEVVVVVESRERGGALITAREAESRGVPVMVVPGSPANPAATGTNRLLRDGCGLVLDTVDVLVALGLAERAAAEPEADDAAGAPDTELLAALGEPADLDALVAVTGRSLVDLALALGRLEEAGWVRRVGPWFERTPAPRAGGGRSLR